MQTINSAEVYSPTGNSWQLRRRMWVYGSRFLAFNRGSSRYDVPFGSKVRRYADSHKFIPAGIIFIPVGIKIYLEVYFIPVGIILYLCA